MKTGKRSYGDKIFDSIVYAVLAVITLVTFFPILYIIAGSFASVKELAVNRFLLIPKEPTLDAYRYIFSTSTLMRSMFVTIMVTVTGTIVNLFMTCLMAYPLSRKELPGRKYLMYGVTFTLVFSGGMIPTYLEMCIRDRLCRRDSASNRLSFSIYHIPVH